mmetsp:Transcript_17130/g.51273  ORF Transcript_17130/g.51273 Transcript_17130/m.51273 type:complete len:272 (-) Transcript_17130:1994-2809(-)
MTVMSGRWEPPASWGWLVTITSPSSMPSPLPAPSLSVQYCSCARTASDMAPRCTGRWGALATRPPSGANRAQLKSRRSLMLTLMLVRCRVRPISSANPMNLWEKMASCTESCWTSCEESTAAEGALRCTSMRTSPPGVMCPVHSGSTTMQEMSSIRMAGPSTTWPDLRSDRRYAGVSCRPPFSKYADVVAAAFGSGPGSEVMSPALGRSLARPVARTRTSSTMIARPARVNPNSRRYWFSKALAGSPPSGGQGVITGTSVPSYRRFRNRST